MKSLFKHSRIFVVTAQSESEFIGQFMRMVRYKIEGRFGKDINVTENKIIFGGYALQFWFFGLLEVIHKGEIQIQKKDNLIKVSYDLDVYRRFIALFFMLLPFAIIFAAIGVFPSYYIVFYPLPYLGFFFLLSMAAFFRFDSVITQCIKDAGGKFH